VLKATADVPARSRPSRTPPTTKKIVSRHARHPREGQTRAAHGKGTRTTRPSTCLGSDAEQARPGGPPPEMADERLQDGDADADSRARRAGADWTQANDEAQGLIPCFHISSVRIAFLAARVHVDCSLVQSGPLLIVGGVRQKFMRGARREGIQLMGSRVLRYWKRFDRRRSHLNSGYDWFARHCPRHRKPSRGSHEPRAGRSDGGGELVILAMDPTSLRNQGRSRRSWRARCG